MACDAKPLRVADILTDSIVDGPGLRLAVFTQGCPHRCAGCHNPRSHDPVGGYEVSIAGIMDSIQKNPLLAGITLTGGEPMEQAAACLSLARALPAGLSLWLYSGYTYEEIRQSGDASRIALLEACDVLVDGRFEIEKRSLALPYRGSANQRLIDMKKTRANGGRVIMWETTAW
ncbi:MAG: anaerobic ribonucleoside-triphosphate reductase activating protein [Firmicutes bacterium]|nr:anaerobic ribonucleoside-triphosphate reductase activating protein [Bacillota bacterium]